MFRIAVYSVSTPEQVFDALVALRDPELRRQLGQQSIEWFEQIHDYRAVLDLVERLFLKAVG